MQRNWKRVHPTSMAHAIRLCLDYALAKNNYSVARVGLLIGKSEWTIYKWMSDDNGNGTMPTRLIIPFEHACGVTFVTQYIAASAHKLIIDMPTGRKIKDTDLLNLQAGFNEAVNLLARFYQGEADADETVSALTATMKDIAAHRENVSHYTTPELGLFDSKGDAEE